VYRLRYRRMENDSGYMRSVPLTTSSASGQLYIYMQQIKESNLGCLVSSVFRFRRHDTVIFYYDYV